MKALNGSKIVMDGEFAMVYLSKNEILRFGVSAVHSSGDSIRRAKIACGKKLAELYRSAETPATASEVAAVMSLISNKIILRDRLASIMKSYIKTGSATVDVYPHAAGLSVTRFVVAAKEVIK
jgi:hypothetical protein